jgi:hypothetical protein
MPGAAVRFGALSRGIMNGVISIMSIPFLELTVYIMVINGMHLWGTVSLME